MSEAVQETMTLTPGAVRRESPLHYVIEAVGGADPLASTQSFGVVLRETLPKGYLNLRGNSDDALFTDGVAATLGVNLPTEPGTWFANDGNAIYWLSPNEWMVTVPGGTETEMEVRLRENLTGHFAVVDVSGGQTRVLLSGADVANVLKKSSGYDFDEQVFGAGRCAQTTLAKATALVSKQSDGSFELIIRRSFADYLFAWIADAAGEYGFKAERETL